MSSEINPPRLSEMTDEQVMELLTGIRARRMLAVHYFEEVQKAREENRKTKLLQRFKVLEDRIGSCLKRIDEDLLKVEGYFGKLAVLKVESTPSGGYTSYTTKTEVS